MALNWKIIVPMLCLLALRVLGEAHTFPFNPYDPYGNNNPYGNQPYGNGFGSSYGYGSPYGEGFSPFGNGFRRSPGQKKQREKKEEDKTYLNMTEPAIKASQEQSGELLKQTIGSFGVNPYASIKSSIDVSEIFKTSEGRSDSEPSGIQNLQKATQDFGKLINENTKAYRKTLQSIVQENSASELPRRGPTGKAYNPPFSIRSFLRTR